MLTILPWVYILQWLIQKKKGDISGEKGAQISVVAKKIVTQWWSKIMIMKYKQAIHDICFTWFSWYFLYYITDLIKKSGLC